MQTKRCQNFFYFARIITLFFLIVCKSLSAEHQTINMLFFHFEPRAYHITRDVMQDSIEQYISTYHNYLYDPDGLKKRMLEDFSFAQDQVAQKKIFRILDIFEQHLKSKQQYKNIDLVLKVHFILWDEAFSFLKQEAQNPTFSVVQIASAFLGGVAEYGNIISLDQFCTQRPDSIYDEKCLRTCRLNNDKELLALPFWASMTALLIRKDMIEAC